MSTAAANVEGRSDAHQYVTVRVGGQLFGLPISSVNEVFVPDRITPVPLASREIDGVLNLRGRIVTMIDMRRLLGLSDGTLARMAVGIERTGEAFALLIDGVGDVLLLRRGRPSPGDGAARGARCRACARHRRWRAQRGMRGRSRERSR